eukprot:12429663-Alexandrium_andersonii.AAC.1
MAANLSIVTECNSATLFGAGALGGSARRLGTRHAPRSAASPTAVKTGSPPTRVLRASTGGSCSASSSGCE